MKLIEFLDVLGDVGSRTLYGYMLNRGASWQTLCWTGAALILGVAALVGLRLKPSPEDLGFEPPEENPSNLFGMHADAQRPRDIRTLLGPLLSRPSFWVILSMSFTLTLIRDAFGEWLPLYLVEVGGLSAGDASIWAGAFPVLGAVSIVATGWCSDRFLGQRRGLLMTILLTMALPALIGLSRLSSGCGPILPVVLSGAVALLTLGPYAFLGGAIALDLGGRSGSATVSGFAEGTGYLSGILSGLGFGALAQRGGWGAAFAMLTVAGAAAWAASLAYWRFCERR